MRANLISQSIDFGAVLEQGAGESLALEQTRMLADGTQEGRLESGKETALANVLTRHRSEGTGFNITLGIDVE